MTKPISLGFLVGSTYKPLIKTLSLNFLAGTTLDSRVTFSRASNATLVDSTGRVTYAPNNLVLRSEEFDNASWGKTASTITPNATVAPNGTTTADKLVENTAATTGHWISPNTPFVPSPALGQIYVFSVYAKAGERTFIQLIVTQQAPGSGNYIAGFDLTNGTAGAPSATVTSTITDVGNGWYRCSMAYPVSTATTGGYQIRLSLNSTSAPSSYTGDGTSGLFVWGAQFEQVTYQTQPSTYVQTVASAYYGPRFDYDPVTLASRGLLIEEQRVNLALYSEQFDNAAWSKSAVSITANATVSPDGTTNADAFVANTSTTFHTLQYYAPASGAAGVSYTATTYLKAAATPFIRIQNDATGFGTQVGQFNLTAVTASTAGGATAASITPAGNGWFRCSVTFTSAGAFTSVGLKLYPTDAGGNGNIAGTGTDSFYVWGAQTELGAFATSYIPTAASTSTRAADNASMTGTNFSSWYNQSEGTVVVECNQVAGANSTSLPYAISDNTFNNSMYGNYSSGNSFRGANLVVGGTGQAGDITTFSVANVAVPIKNAFAYAVNNFGESLGGQAARTDTVGIVNTASNRMYLGSNWSGSGNYLNGHLRSISYYPVRWANAQLPSLTV